MTESVNLLFLNSVTLTITVFSAHLLILRSFERQVYLPLAVCLISIGIIISAPTLKTLLPNLRLLVLLLSLPAILLIAPCFWFYARGLTSEVKWKFSQESKKHLLPSGIGGVVVVITLFLPSEIRTSLLVDGDETILLGTHPVFKYFIYAVMTLIFLLMVGWVAQSAFYFVKIIRLLSRYRTRLKDIFASTESREIRWLSWLLMAVGITWAVVAILLISDNFYLNIQLDATFINAVILIMVWSLAIWGLRQKPGFEEFYNYNMQRPNIGGEETPTNSKYQRSALNQQQSSRIADRIEKAMSEDKLYLDAALSLQKLASHITIPANYISQTLNETMGKNFFDYVNGYRIEEAKQRLRESNDNILAIAMDVGFNAKSSFYTAFKKEIQMAPGKYRKQIKESEKH